MARRMMKRAQRQAVLAAIARREWLLQMVALTATGCGRATGRASSHDSTLTIAYWGEQHALSPYEDDSAKFLMFLPLVGLDAKGDLRGRLADRWELSADYHEWTYHLRRGVRWHDGTPVTAHDIKFTADLFTADPLWHNGNDNSFPLGESVTVIDDSTVRIRYPGDPGDDPTYAVYLPKHLLEGLDAAHWADWDFWKHPVGNGPFRFVRFSPQTMMELEANPDFYAGKPRIERVVLQFGGRGLTNLLAGTVDLIPGVLPNTDILTVAADERFRVYSGYPGFFGVSFGSILWKGDHPLFRDRRVRQALTLAINRQELLGVLNYPRDTPIVDAPYQLDRLRRGDLPAPLPYDPAQAALLLEQVGWRLGAADGIRRREGRPFQFTMLIRANQEESPAAVYVQNQLRRVGVQMDIQALDSGVVRARRNGGNFEAELTFHSFGPSQLRAYFAPNSRVGYPNAKLVELADRLSVTAEPQALDRIRRDIAQIFRTDLPMTFLFPYEAATFAHRRLRGLNSPWRVDPFSIMEELWIEE